MRIPSTIEDVVALLSPIEGLRVNNHWIPASYLAAFTSNGRPDGELWMYTRARCHAPVATGVPRTAVERRLYVAETADAPIPDGVERVLARFIEEPFPAIRNRIVFGESVGLYPGLPPTDLAALSLWIAVQHGRTPHARDLHLWFDELGATLKVLAQANSAPEAELSSERRANVISQVRTGGVVIRAPKERWLGRFLGACLEASKLIRELEFVTVRLVASEPPLPVPDCPVVITRRERGTLEYDYEAGWAHPDLEAILALTPRVALIIRSSSAPDSVLGTPLYRATIRERLVRNARRFLYASQRAQVLEALLETPSAPDPVVAFGNQRHRAGAPVHRVAAAIADDGPGSVFVGHVPRGVLPNSVQRAPGQGAGRHTRRPVL